MLVDVAPEKDPFGFERLKRLPKCVILLSYFSMEKVHIFM